MTWLPEELHYWNRKPIDSTSRKRPSQWTQKRTTLPQYCWSCPHLHLCWGECPKNRLVRTPDGKIGLNYLCPGLRRFYAHIQRDMPAILRQVRKDGPQ